MAATHRTTKPQWRHAALATLLLALGSLLPAGQQAYAQIVATPYDKIPNFCTVPTDTTVKSGNWSDPTIWSTGKVPGAGDIVSIGHAVTYDVASTSPTAVDSVCVTGALNFRPDITTTLYVTNLLVMPAGTLQVGTAANPIAANVTATIVIADTPMDTVKDPAQYGHGLIALGTITMSGQPLANTWIKLAANAHIGDITLTLAQPASGWKAGDTVYLPDSSNPDVNGQVNGKPWTPMQEKVKLASISADGLTLTLASALKFDHTGLQNHTGKWFLPDVANMTRNVAVKSSSATQPARGYAMFTGRANVNIQYVNFGGLGRQTNAVPDDTTYDTKGNVTHVGTDQENRNAVTLLHLIGPTTPQANGYQYTFAGNVVTCPLNPMPFRWGINMYDSHYGLIKDNVVVNWQGAGIIGVTGSETGNVIAHNFVAQISGGPGRADFRVANRDYGFEGGPFWFGGFNNSVNDNVATDAAYAGYTYYGRGTVKAPPFQGADYSQYVTVQSGSIPIRQFSNNEAYGVMGYALTIWGLGAGFTSVDPTMGPSMVDGFTAWGPSAYYGYETTNLTFDHFTALADGTLQGNQNNSNAGLFFSDYLTNNFTVNHADIEGFGTGYYGSTYASGTITLENSFFQNVYNIVVQTPSASGSNTNSASMPPRTLLAVNDTFASLPHAGGRPQLNIVMGYRDGSGNGGFGNYIVPDTVFVTDYNGVAGDNFQVFYNEQAPGFLVPQTNSTRTIGSPEAGLTNAQNWAKYGIAIAGAVAP